MKKHNFVIISAILLGLTFTPLTTALAENNLVQLDLKRGSGNAIDVTFFTSENYGGNVIVRKKSDNKYVILMPKVLTSGYRSADLGSVRELVSNVDVKSVNDGAAGYTKITFITTKPLNITTHTVKAAPPTEEQKQYRTLIAEAYTVKNNINKAPQKAAPQKTEVTVNKAVPVQKLSQAPKTMPVEQKIQSKDDKSQNKLIPLDTQKLLSKAPEINQVSQNAQKKENVDLAKVAPQVPQVFDTSVIPDVEPQQEQVVLPAAPQTVQDVKEVDSVQKNKILSLSLSKIKSKLFTLKREVHNKMQSGLVTTLILITIPLIALLAFVKLIRASIKNSRILKKTFLERISKKPRQKDYEHIINNENLNWQEKYKLFLNQAEEGNMTDNMTQKSITPEIVEDTTNSTIDVQRERLEQLITPQDTPKVDNTPVKSEDVKVHSEENAILNALKDAAKMNAFAPDLSEAKRTVKFKKSRFTRFATKEDYVAAPKRNVISPLRHSTDIQLKKTPLTGSTRQLADANLKVSSVKKDDYIVSSLEEFFASSPVITPQTISQLKPLTKAMKARTSVAPVEKVVEMKTTTAEEVPSVEKPRFSTLDIKNRYDIDGERGFYIAEVNGASALVGRIGEEVFVLKKFDDLANKRLQVRHDKDDIYMVRTDDFKSLVDANNMGVLIEL